MTIRTRSRTSMQNNNSFENKKRGREAISSDDDDDETYVPSSSDDETEEEYETEEESESSEEEEESSGEEEESSEEEEEELPSKKSRNEQGEIENHKHISQMFGSDFPPLVIIAPSHGRPKTRKSSENDKELQSSFTDEEHCFYAHLDPITKERLSQVHKDVCEKDSSTPPYKFRILQSNMSIPIKRAALKRLEIFNAMTHPEGEYHKIRKWMDKLCSVPFGKTIPMPVNKSSAKEEIQTFLTNTKHRMDTEVYGHQEAKDTIVRIMAQWVSNPNSRGNVIGIHGNPGVGKTTLIKDGVCPAIGLPFAFIPLGGANDASYLDGHSYTYEGSSNGKIIDCIIQSGCDNPVLYFDELDKVSDTPRGKEIINVLIHLTDPSQNTHFNDKYFADMSFDLSKCLIVFTYNNPHLIDPILKDRMVTIHTKDYSVEDKIQIASKHLLPSVLKQFGLNPQKIILNDEMMKYIINKIDKEAGVRNLKRALESIVSNINLADLLQNKYSDNEVTVDHTIVDEFVKGTKDNEFLSAHMYM